MKEDGMELEVHEPTGAPNDSGIDNIPGMEIPPTETIAGPSGGGGLVLPPTFIRGIISAPFNVAHGFFGDSFEKLSEEELEAGILPIQAWIEETTASMGIEKPNQFMALMWLGTVMLPRALAVVASKGEKKVKQSAKKVEAKKEVIGQEVTEPEEGDLGNGLYIEPESN